MASGPVDPASLFFDARNTARPTRGRFHYQDECVALRCIANLVYGAVTAVVVEWSTDYIAVLAAVPSLVAVLAALHQTGLAHRHLHPDGLFLAGGQLRLLDTGLAVVPIAVGEGPPDYRAPEQDSPMHGPPGAATDVYQLAAIVYHLAVGQPPGTDPPPASAMRPGLSERLDPVLAAGLAAQPDRRPSLRALAAALRGVLRSGGAMPC